MASRELPFRHITLVGIGLIGSSLSHAIRRADETAHIHIIDADADNLARAETIGLGNSYSGNCDEANDSDLVILCTPVGAMGQICSELGPNLKPGAVVTDVGSVKEHVEKTMADTLPDSVITIPGHPVSGTEQSGPDAGFATLFDDRWCILTPNADTDKAALARLTGFWEMLGAKVDTMTADHHDLVLAITSHVPHLIAYNIVGTAADLEKVTQSEVISYSAGGFRDFTRIAASDPTMWRDVFLMNKSAVLEMLGRFQEDLSALARAIRWDDGDSLYNLFSRTREIRRGIVDAGQDVAGADFGRERDHLDPDDQDED